MNTLTGTGNRNTFIVPGIIFYRYCNTENLFGARLPLFITINKFCYWIPVFKTLFESRIPLLSNIITGKVFGITNTGIQYENCCCIEIQKAFWVFENVYCSTKNEVGELQKKKLFLQIFFVWPVAPICFYIFIWRGTPSKTIEFFPWNSPKLCCIN